MKMRIDKTSVDEYLYPVVETLPARDLVTSTIKFGETLYDKFMTLYAGVDLTIINQKPHHLELTPDEFTPCRLVRVHTTPSSITVSYEIKSKP